MEQQLTNKERLLIFWGSFLALATAGVGFAFRVIHGGSYGAELNLDNKQIGDIFGATLWPIGVTMILGSLVIDRIGYKFPMIIAFVLQIAGIVGTFYAGSYTSLYWFGILLGLAHGIIECAINPLCATIYHNQKTKMLTILHAAWPVGLAIGAVLCVTSNHYGMPWRNQILWMGIFAVPYILMIMKCRFPEDERVKAGVPYIDMLKQVGFLGCFLAASLLTYEIGNQFFALTKINGGVSPEPWLMYSSLIGVVIALIFGFLVKSVGQPLFFFMLLLMVPLAAAELGTDGWIQKLMKPVLENWKLDPGLSLAASAGIMMFLRFFAGGILKIFSPPVLLTISGVFSAIGLYWLAGATGVFIFIAFVIYAIGQTFYWPCMLGFVAERYPKGGALTLNCVTAIGLLSLGVFAFPFMGAAFDKAEYDRSSKAIPELVEATGASKTFFAVSYDSIDKDKKVEYIKALPESAQNEINEKYKSIEKDSGRDILKIAAIFPAILVVCFGGIALYFRSKGGYKPVELDLSSE